MKIKYYNVSLLYNEINTALEVKEVGTPSFFCFTRRRPPLSEFGFKHCRLVSSRPKTLIPNREKMPGPTLEMEPVEPQSLKKLSLKSLKRALDLFSPIHGQFAAPNPERLQLFSSN